MSTQTLMKDKNSETECKSIMGKDLALGYHYQCEGCKDQPRCQYLWNQKLSES